MATSYKPYFDALEVTLNACLCLTNFPSEFVEKYDKPEIETRYSLEVIANPITISRNEREKVNIQVSINSMRINVLLKQMDDMDRILCRKFAKHMMLYASADFPILRKKPMPGYSITFLITNNHLVERKKEKLIEFVINFLRDVDREISEQKIGINSRARICAEEFLKMF